MTVRLAHRRATDDRSLALWVCYPRATTATESWRLAGAYLLRRAQITPAATAQIGISVPAMGNNGSNWSMNATVAARRRERDPLAELTDRERQVLALMAQGLTNAALSEELFVSVKTVEGYIRNVFTKLGLHQVSASTGGCWHCCSSCVSNSVEKPGRVRVEAGIDGS